MQSSKLYNLKFENRPEYLYAKITAEKETLEISEAAWKEIVQECKQEKCDKLLVEQDIPEIDISYFEKYECVNNLVGALMKINVAFVDKYVEQMALNNFAELVATNRGLSVKMFTDSDEAERWLLSA